MIKSILLVVVLTWMAISVIKMLVDATRFVIKAVKVKRESVDTAIEIGITFGTKGSLKVEKESKPTTKTKEEKIEE